jgi:DNA-binding beta-propeller fold protein YncE
VRLGYRAGAVAAGLISGLATAAGGFRRVGSAPTAVGVDPRTRSIYLTDIQGGTVSVLTWPGSVG